MFPQEIESWLFTVALKKVVVIAVKGVISLIGGAVAQHLIVKLGVTYDPIKLQEGLTVLMLGGVEAVHDWLKLKFPTVVKF